jgi:hypothetical protein
MVSGKYTKSTPKLKIKDIKFLNTKNFFKSIKYNMQLSVNAINSKENKQSENHIIKNVSIILIPLNIQNMCLIHFVVCHSF